MSDNDPDVTPEQWAEWRAARRTRHRAPDWPEGVRSLSWGGANLIGIDDQNRLYYDGKLVEFARPLSLTFWQRIGAVLAVAAAVVGAGAAVASAVADWTQ